MTTSSTTVLTRLNIVVHVDLILFVMTVLLEIHFQSVVGVIYAEFVNTKKKCTTNGSFFCNSWGISCQAIVVYLPKPRNAIAIYLLIRSFLKDLA